MSDPLLPQIRALLDQWKTLRAALRADVERDRAEGLPRSVEAGEVAIATMNGHINSLEAILPVDA